MKKVSVICLCYNQGKFVERALNSVWKQTYKDIELIIVDDASEDKSVEIIEAVIRNRPDVQFYSLEENIGNCAAFNFGWEKATGDYFIDLAADDEFLTEKVERQVKKFEELPDDFGVVHHDVEVVNEVDQLMWMHFDKVRKRLKKDIPQGHIFEDLLKSFIVSAPSMMFKREVLEELGGYDDDLSYEDFDFWVRSSVNWKYAHLEECLMKVHKVSGRMTELDRIKFEEYSVSTLRVCEKALKISKEMNLTFKPLRIRAYYEMRQAVKFGSWKMIKKWMGFIRRGQPHRRGQ